MQNEPAGYPVPENSDDPAVATILYDDGFDPSQKEVCLFVAYAPDGTIGQGLSYLIGSFDKMNIAVVLCLITEKPAPEISNETRSICRMVLARRNTGYDFGAWAGMLRAVPALWNANRLYFVNDSILGPNENFESMIQKIRSQSESFIALTANWIDFYHAQSYFFVLNRDALTNQRVKSFWNNLPDYKDKITVIRQCEQRQLGLIADAGLSSHILFPVDLRHMAKAGRFNPTHHAWKELLESGFPFLKADLFYRRKISIRGWSNFFPEPYRQMVNQQVKEIMSTRFPLTIHPGSTRLTHKSRYKSNPVYINLRIISKRLIAHLATRNG